MAISDYLRKLVDMKNQLVANLKSMGVTADESEKLNTLVPKVLECKGEQNVEFDEESKIISINIPSGTTSIGDYAFNYLYGLKSITIPASVTSIGSGAFRECTSLASITIPNGVTSIGNQAFYNCTSLANIYYIGTEEQWNAITKGISWNTNMGSNVSGGTVIHYNYTG